MRKTISLFLALLLLFTLTVPANAADEAIGSTLRLEDMSGTVTVKDASGLNKSVRKGMRLYSGYSIVTGISSSAYISLDDTKAVKLDSSGTVEIKKTGKKLEISLASGQLYFNVTEPLKTDESLNIRTSTMVTGIRGSFGWVNATRMALMHGHVTLTCINPETGERRVTEVYSGEQVRYEESVSPEIAADPVLLEIEFVKEEVKVEDVPAIVVEQVANDVTLQTQLEEVETINVTELVESLESKRETEAIEEQAAAAEVTASYIAQEETIAASISETADLGDTAQVYADLTTVAPPAVGGGGGSGSGPSVYTVTVYTTSGDLVVYSPTHTGTTVNNDASVKEYSVSPGSALTLAIDIPVAADGKKYELTSTPGAANDNYLGEFALNAAGNAYTLSVPVSGNMDLYVSTGSAFMRLNSSDVVSDAATIHTYLDKYERVLLDLSAEAGGDLTLANTLSVTANQNLELAGGTLTLNNAGTAATIRGSLSVRHDAALNVPLTASQFIVTNRGSVGVDGTAILSGSTWIDSGSDIFCDGSLTNKGNATVYGDLFIWDTFTNGDGTTPSALTIAGGGTLNNSGTIQNKTNATITNNGTIENESGIINNETGATFTNNAMINN